MAPLVKVQGKSMAGNNGSITMKVLFGMILGVLTVASFATMYMNPEEVETKPALYWTTDSNPARTHQVKTFKSWLKKNSFQDVDLRIDTANADPSKKIIQAVSGVAGDLMDCQPSAGELLYFTEAGFVEDLTEDAVKMGFDPSSTYPSIRDDMMIDGRQYVFPCSANAQLMLVNRDTFKSLGVEPPPMRWSLDEFERAGKAFNEAVDRANGEGVRRERFFCDQIPLICVVRSLGGDLFNETMTKASINGPAFIKACKLLYKWTYEDHLMPTPAEMASFSAGSGYGGMSAQLFNSGNYGMVFYGRYVLIQLRQFGSIDLDAVEVPNGGFPNTVMAARSELVYKGGRHKDIAKLFLSYLASEDYNMTIVEDADSLPPNPKYTRIEAYLKPPKYPNEWRIHSKFAKEAVDISIVYSKSPFISNNLAYRFLDSGYGAVLSNVMSPEDAARDIQERIDAEIERTVKENPKLQAAYVKALAMQGEIDGRIRSGGKLSADCLKNPFHRKYYKAMDLVSAEGVAK